MVTEAGKTASAETSRLQNGEGESNAPKSLKSIVGERGWSTSDTTIEIDNSPYDQAESTVDNTPWTLVTEQTFDYFARPTEGEDENQIWELSQQGCPKVLAFSSYDSMFHSSSIYA